MAVWITAGYLLHLPSNGYLLLRIPLTAAFQLLVLRRPLRELFAAGTARFALTRRGAAIATVLAVTPRRLRHPSSVDRRLGDRRLVPGRDQHRVDVTGIHALTKEIAPGFARPMAPEGSYILGLAIGARAATGARVDPDALSATIRATFPSAT